MYKSFFALKYNQISLFISKVKGRMKLILLRPPLIQFSKYNNFFWVCWFLCKNLSNFVPPFENSTTRIAIVLACLSFGECTARVKLELTDFSNVVGIICPLIGIGLTDLPKSGWAIAIRPYTLVPTALWWWQNVQLCTVG